MVYGEKAMGETPMPPFFQRIAFALRGAGKLIEGWHFKRSGGTEDHMHGRLIHVEQEQLDHQLSRLEAIIAADMVSPKMKSDLLRLVDDIGIRMWELSKGNENLPEPMRN